MKGKYFIVISLAALICIMSPSTVFARIFDFDFWFDVQREQDRVTIEKGFDLRRSQENEIMRNKQDLRMMTDRLFDNTRSRMEDLKRRQDDLMESMNRSTGNTIDETQEKVRKLKQQQRSY